ncbi:MAG: hypothetical protein M1274_02710 [Actinobacteria bacterium]|nr:hypothetical protein [Actinomycetota bacterium]
MAIAIASLVLMYVVGALVVVGARTPGAVFSADFFLWGFIGVSVGCLWLLTGSLLMERKAPGKSRGVLEASVGFASIPVAFASLIGTFVREERLDFRFLPIFAVLIVAAVGLVVVATKAKRAADAWSNIGQD